MNEKKEQLLKIIPKESVNEKEELSQQSIEELSQQSINEINDFPVELITNIFSFSHSEKNIGRKELEEFTRKSKFFNQMFQSQYRKSVLVPKLLKYTETGEENNKVIDILNKYPKYMSVELLLHCIACGNQDMAQKIIEEHPECLLQRGSVTDFSGCTFKNIAPYELGLYYFDAHMLDMMHESVSKVEDLVQQKQILIQLQKQYKTVITDYDKEKGTGGVHYTIDGKKYHEQHFDLQPLIDALQTYSNNYNNWDIDQCRKHWCSVIGKLQTLLPAHVRQEYCYPDRSFDPTPDFKEKTLKRGLKFYNWIKEVDQYWDGSVTGLGVEFGICASGGRGLPDVWPGAWAAAIDVVALTSLFKTRKEQIFELKDLLSSSIQKLDEKQNSLNLMY